MPGSGTISLCGQVAASGQNGAYGRPHKARGAAAGTTTASSTGSALPHRRKDRHRPPRSKIRGSSNAPCWPDTPMNPRRHSKKCGHGRLISSGLLSSDAAGRLRRRSMWLQHRCTPDRQAEAAVWEPRRGCTWEATEPRRGGVKARCYGSTHNVMHTTSPRAGFKYSWSRGQDWCMRCPGPASRIQGHG